MTGAPAYDVFVSYRQQPPDGPWVREVLVPHLLAADVRVCVDYRDFRLGVPLVLQMADAVERSRLTLAVLTPAYTRSAFSELESVLAEHLGLEQAERRLVAVLRETSEQRLGMRARLWLDLTDESTSEAGLARLVTELRADA